MKLTPALALVLFLLPRPATAQDVQARRDTVVLPAIVVTAPRLTIPLTDDPAAIKVVGSEQLDLPRGIAVDEAMMLVPGIRVENQADGKRVHLESRGQGILAETGIRGIGILLDGLPLNDPTGFAPDLYDIDWPTVSQVEVQRGPAGSLYGGGSAAGVINITTADGAALPAHGDLSSTYGSNGFWRGTADLGGTLGDVNYRMSYTHNTGDGYRVHTAFHGDNLYAKAHWSPSAALHLTPILGYTTCFNQNAEGLNLTWLAQDRRQANPDALTYNEYQDTKRLVGGVVGRWDLGVAQSLSGDIFVRHTAWRESVPSSVDHRSMLSPGATLQYTIERPTGALQHHLSVGTDLQWQSIDDYTHANLGGAVEGPDRLSDQTFGQSGAGVFALDRIDVGRQWSVMLNLRYDYVGNKLTDHLKSGGVDLSGNADFWAWTTRGGITWNPSPGLSFYGNVGQGFLPPATEELSANPVQIGGFNQSLKAATSLGEEVGARGAVGTVVFDVGAFRLNTDNDFDRYRVASRPLETFYRNAGSSRRYGVEASVAWAPVSPLLLRLAYTWSDFKYTNSVSAYGDVNGHWLPNSPEHRLVADGAYSIGPATLGVTSETVSRWYVDPSNAASVDGYTLLHARLAWRVSVGGTRAQILAEVRNIFAVQYMGYTEPDPDGNSYQPAAEREMFVGFVLGK
ncbi:MAG TPA: TonB-dependent receptor [Gemmatimonadales bacterium]|nr:TonB-dependent receptor [Gemmatimonadales bacterium]